MIWTGVEGVFESYGFIIVSTLALLAGTCRSSLASLCYGVLASVAAFANKRTIFQAWRCIMTLIALYVALQYGILLTGEYVALGLWAEAPWKDYDKSYQVWLGFKIENNYLLFVDFFTLIAAATQMRLLSNMNLMDQRTWFKTQEAMDHRLNNDISKMQKERAQMLEDRVAIVNNAYREMIETLKAKMNAYKRQIAMHCPVKDRHLKVHMGIAEQRDLASNDIFEQQELKLAREIIEEVCRL